MSYETYDCAHCGHPLLDPGWTTRYVNRWMSKGVLMLADGTRVLGTVDDEQRKIGRFSYEHLGSSKEAGGEDVVAAHQACWRHDGKPEFEGYAQPSKFSDELTLTHEGHDMEEPGAEIDGKLWDAAIRLRTERQRRDVIQKVAERLDPPDYKADHGYGSEYERYEANCIETPEGGRPDWWPAEWMPGWSVSDRAFISDLPNGEENVYGIETEAEAVALAAKLSKKWREGEGAELLAEWHTWQEHYLAEWQEEVRASGIRYEVKKHPRFDMDHPTWEISDVDNWRGYGDGIKNEAEAQAKCVEMNAQWVADGMPLKTGRDNWDNCWDFVRCKKGYQDADAAPIFCAEDEERKRRQG